MTNSPLFSTKMINLHQKCRFFCICQKKVVILQRKIDLSTMNDYRFINIDQEPSEEQLAQLMHEVAVEAKERHDRAHAAYYAHLDQMLQAL